MNNQFEQFNKQLRNLQGNNLMLNFKTPRSLAWAVKLLVGFFPMMFAWMFFNNGADGMMNNELIPSVYVSFGAMNAIAWSIILIDIVVVIALTKFTKTIKMDVLAPTIGIAMMMLNFYIFYGNGNWRYLIAPVMYLAGFLMGMVIRGIVFFSGFKKQMKQMQANNPFANGNPDMSQFENDPIFKAAKEAQASFEKKVKDIKEKEEQQKDEIEVVDDEEE